MLETAKQLISKITPDYGLQKAMDSFIYTTSLRSAISSHTETWQKGKPLKLLFAGYAGSRNTGADVRVEEMIRQVRHLLGDENIMLSIITIDPKATAGYFSSVKPVHMPQIFPPFLFTECPKHHGVIACEGSMFKSKFADALSTMMAGALGMANAEGKLSVGYGAEAGAMNPSLKHFVKKHCADSLVICRNEQSQEILERMDIRTKPGADTAWTFSPSPASTGQTILKKHGWDGKQPLLVVCPINPFWWPVKADVVKQVQHVFLGMHRQQHYKSVYFHDYDQRDQKAYQTYISELALAADRFAKKHNAFVVSVGMEKLDRSACEDFSVAMPNRVPVLVSDDYNMYDLVSVIRQGSFMISSRFHAIVCSMPAKVLSVGVTMDERIRNLMKQRGHDALSLEVDELDLGEKVFQALENMQANPEQYGNEIAKTVFGEIEKMAWMGKDFLEEVARVYPDFTAAHKGDTWQSYLPTLSKSLQELGESIA
ncbi:MAG: polysaccharide pyruvyl transferase family protein [Bdellovibrionota bacterium]